MRCLLVYALLGYVAAVEMFGRDQSSAVKGRLMCNGRPAVGVKVKLWDVDRTDMDDLMDEKLTDSNGEFHLAGWTKEYTTIDPKLSIYHDCEDGIKPCQRKFSILIPDSYVSHGKVPRKGIFVLPGPRFMNGRAVSEIEAVPEPDGRVNTYDAGTIQLAGAFPGESRDCLN